MRPSARLTRSRFLWAAASSSATAGVCQPCDGDNGRMDVISEVAAFASGLGLGVANMLLRDRSARSDDRLVRAREAADGLLGPLRDLRDLARVSEHAPQPAADWADAMTGITETWDRLGHRMPRDAAHLRHSVRAAIGTYVGGPAAADLYPRLRDVEVAAHDAEWRAHAEDYVSFAVHGLQRWRDEPVGRTGRRVGVVPFDDWLVGRRW